MNLPPAQLDRAPIDPPVLRTPRLLLRVMTEADRGAFVAAENDSAAFFAAFARLAVGPTDTDGRFTRLLGQTAQGLAEGTHVRLSAFLHSGALVGQVGLSDVVRGVSQRCNIGWRVYRVHARQGYATEAIRAVLDYALGPLGLHRVECGIQPDNMPSLTLAEKLGFRRFGYAERFLYIGDGWKDHILLAIDRESRPVH